MFRLVLLSVALGVSAYASPCRHQLVAWGVAPLLQPGAVESLERVDDVLRAHLVGLSTELSDGGVRTLSLLLERSVPLSIARPIDDYDTEFLAHISVSFRRVLMRYRDFLKTHPLGRLVLAHECAHLIHSLNRWNLPILSSRLFWRVHFRPAGVLAEERWAFGSEWDFLRAAYRPEDLPQLRTLYPRELPEDARAVLVRFGLLRAAAAGGEVRLMADDESERLRQTEPAVARALAAYRWTAMNDEFMATAERALVESRETFVDRSLHERYRRAQRQSTWRAAAVLGALGTLATAVTAWLAH